MSRQQTIHDVLTAEFKPDFLLIENESYRHQVPSNSETHFKVIAVSSVFEPLSRVARHRLINNALAKEFTTGLHALSLHLYSPTEWLKKGGDVRSSPLCQQAIHQVDSAED